MGAKPHRGHGCLPGYKYRGGLSRRTVRRSNGAGKRRQRALQSLLLDIRDIARIVNTLNKGIAVTLTVYGRGRHGETESESDCAVVVPAGRSIATLTPPKSFPSYLLPIVPMPLCARWMHVLGCLSRSKLSFCVAARCLGVSTGLVDARHFGGCFGTHGAEGRTRVRTWAWFWGCHRNEIPTPTTTETSP